MSAFDGGALGAGFSVTMIRCKPNRVLTGSETTNGSLLNATSSNSLTIWPLWNRPRSPPLPLEGQSEWAFASSANFSLSASPFRPSSCFFRSLIVVSAFFAVSASTPSVLTRMCEARTFSAASAARLSSCSTSFGSMVALDANSVSMNFWMSSCASIFFRLRSLPKGSFSASSAIVLGASAWAFFARSASSFLRSSSVTFTPFLAASSAKSVSTTNCCASCSVK